jgi:glycosyltransferase involved in cell wall biosynthesis
VLPLSSSPQYIPVEPLVSVVIPTFDRLALLREAVESVRAQTYAAWEVVVADDGSGDGTREYLGSLDDPRVRAVYLPHTGHIGRVRNAGAAAARGEYLAFVDSDDVWLPRKLEVQVARIREDGAAWSYTGYDFVDQLGRPASRHVSADAAPADGWTVRDVLTDRADIANSTLMVERAAFQRLGGYSEAPWLQLRGDRELQLRLAYHGRPAPVVEVLTLMRHHGGRTTSGIRDPHERSARVFDAFLAWCPDPDLRRLARARRSQLLRTAAMRRLRSGSVGPALVLAARSLGMPGFRGPPRR